jgi:peptidoglycan/xylan/chitin deacetylase (PgdA/CDA1 family)
MILLIICSIIFVLLAFLTIKYSLLIPPVKGLPVLMYHKISESKADDLTIKRDDLYQQLLFLKQNNYTSIFCSDVIANLKNNTTLPQKPVLITFDDAYQNNFEFLLPILKELQLKATIFIPTKYIGNVNVWDKGLEPIMNGAILNAMPSELVEFGLHSHAHPNYNTITINEIEEDIEQCIASLNSMNIKYTPTITYPYGKYPRKETRKSEFQNLLKKHNIELGFRIGNRINKLPLKKMYELKRIDIKGTDSFWTFKTKLKKGRVKLF